MYTTPSIPSEETVYLSSYSLFTAYSSYVNNFEPVFAIQKTKVNYSEENGKAHPKNAYRKFNFSSNA